MTLRSRFRLAAGALTLVLAAAVAAQQHWVGSVSTRPALAAVAQLSILAIWVVGILVLDRMVLVLVARPVGALDAAMRRLAEGGPAAALPIARRDELGQALETFNELQAAIDARRREHLATAARSLEFQHELRHTETLGFAGKFGSALGHEISTPLNVIAGRIAIARTKLPPSSSARDDLNIVLTQTERIGSMIRTLLEPLRVPPPALAPTDIHPLVEPLLARLAPLAEARSIELVLDVAPDTPRIRADAGQLTQALTSLLTNAVETAPSGTKLSVRAQTVRADGRAVLELSIHDSGSVIPAHLLARIFDPVFPTKAATNGTSLALSTARDIIRGHSGELSVDSEAGVGTIFTCWLPVIEEDKQ
jgi:signal transduction histidine kinase